MIRQYVSSSRIRALVCILIVLYVAIHLLSTSASLLDQPGKISEAEHDFDPEPERSSSPLGALGLDRLLPGKRKKLLITGGASQLGA